MRPALFAGLLAACSLAFAGDCYKASVLSPVPFMGNHEEVFKLDDGSSWEVLGAFEFLYAYYPVVTVCPRSHTVFIEDKKITVQPVRPPLPKPPKQK